MRRLKIERIPARHGEVGWRFVDADGRRHSLPVVGRVWRRQGSNIGVKWCAVASVVAMPGGTLWRVGKTARWADLLMLDDGEVYLPVAVTGAVLALDELPKNERIHPC